MKHFLSVLLGIAVLTALVVGCAAAVYVPDPPPSPREEIRPLSPGPRAIWVEGWWKWSHRHYVWIPGHWERRSHGQWVPGQWEKRPRGWVWTRGHWRR
ncbi:MAG: hypothetical protein WCE90_05260 [Candidatus Zixiibacteriota bacterium]